MEIGGYLIPKGSTVFINSHTPDGGSNDRPAFPAHPTTRSPG
jgi:hypothetical protein